jgi:hypothetical protein
MHVEHFEPQSRRKGSRNTYSNCFYICRFCNLARSALANQSADGRQLLNPVEHVWLEAFVAFGDEVRPRRADDGDAEYTCETYRLNDRLKVRLRKLRREVVNDCLDYLRRADDMERRLLDQAEKSGQASQIETAWAIAAVRSLAYRDLLRFQAVPADSDADCRCGDRAHHTLPRVLEEQTIDI